MEENGTKRIDAHVAVWGALLCAGSTYLWGQDVVLGTFLGAVLAFVNWRGFSFLMKKLLTSPRRVRFAILLGGKTILMFGVVALLVLHAPVDKLALVAGLSSLFLGITTHSIQVAFSQGEVTLEEDC